MTSARPHPASIAALACAACSLWVSMGALAFLDTHNRAPYVGILPSPLWLLVFVVAASVIAAAARPTPRVVAPLWLSAVLLLPWLPIPWPLAVFIWTGHLVGWVWMAIVLSMAAPRLSEAGRALATMFRLSEPKRAAAVAGMVSLVSYGLAAWIVAPQHPGGDEPHYLIITQSLLKDHDLQIENNHQQQDYRAYTSIRLKPDYLHRGQNGQIYSIHAPGLPALIAPVFAVSGYPGVVAALVIVSACTSALAWLLAWRVTQRLSATWFAWAAVSLSAPYFLLTGSVFPDAPAALVMLLAGLAVVDERARQPRALFVIGAALALLPWMHSRFAVLAASSAFVILGRILGDRDRIKRTAVFLLAPALSAIGWFAFFQVVYGRMTPSAPYGGKTDMAVANLVRGIPGLLVDQQFGLLTTAPVYLCAAAGLIVMLWRGPRRLAAELLVLSVPYSTAVALYYMWWAGSSTPARFIVPVLPLLVIPLAIWMSRALAVGRAFGWLTLLVSVLLTITTTLVGNGAFVFNFRDGISRQMRWLTPVVDFTRAVPSLFQNQPPLVVTQAAILLVALAAALISARVLARVMPAVVALGLMLEIAAMAGVAVVWRTNHADAATPSSGGAAVLSQLVPGSQQIALTYRPLHRVNIRDLPPQIVLERTLSSSPQREWTDIAHVPPSVLEISGTVTGAPAGHLRVLTDRRTPPLIDWEVAEFEPTWKRTITVPVALAALQIDLDNDARKHVRDLTVRAVRILPEGERVAGSTEGGRASRYGPAMIFAVNGTSWVEPGGIWVGGNARATFVVQPDPRTPLRLFLRNGPHDNRVALSSRAWAQKLELRPGEERVVDVPVDVNVAATPLAVAAEKGFRPFEVDPKSDDDRYLGVWMATQ